jgi:hypothetical protein
MEHLSAGQWSKPDKPPPGIDKWPFWDDAMARFTLGDFNNVPTFLQAFIGARSLKPMGQVIEAPK